MARVRAGLMALAAMLAAGATLGAAAQTTATAETPATVLPANPPTCTAKTLGVSRASNPGLAADCDTLLAIQSTLRVSGWIDYDAPLLWDHSYALNWSAITPLSHWRTVTLGGTPQRVTGLNFGDTRESVRVFNARTRQWAEGQPYTREWTLRGVIPTQLGSLTALEMLDLGGSELTGIVPTQLGSLALLRTLDLSNNRLTGELPKELDALTALARVRVAGNAFTLCAPHGLWAAASHDLATLGLPDCRPTVSYGAPQATGVVDAPGEYAFFTATGTAITTYEGLRNDVARITIHEQDTAGTPWAWFYDGVDAGDMFEWREADDCWVRYVVEEVLADPSATLKSLSLEWMTYAFTGCSGAVPASVTGSMNWGALPDLGGASLTVPIRHGPFQVLPDGWTGAIDPGETYALPDEAPPYPGPVVDTEALGVARGFPYWRDPVLPDGWTFSSARSGGYDVSYGYCATYVAADGYPAVDVCGEALWLSGTYPVEASWYARGDTGERRLGVHETRTLAGRPAIVVYSPQGQHHHRTGAVRVLVYNPATQSIYTIVGTDPSLRGSNVDAVIAIARSLFGEVAAQPRTPAATGCTDATLGLPDCRPTVSYGAPQTTGVVDAPGEYAFFTATGTAITTYEGLRNDVARITIHEQDTAGTSWAWFYDDVEVGDDFEWREADDCWVRYVVEQVLPDPTDTPLKVLAVRRYGYAYTGCSGMVSLTGERTLTWVPPNIQSPDITVPVRHGPWLLVPPQWTGTTEEQTRHPPPTVTPDDAQGDSSTAQWLPPWREPVVPEGWTFRGRQWGDPHLSPLHGYDAYYDNEMGYPAITITVAHREWIPASVYAIEAGAPALGEIRVIEGYSALLYYSPEDNVAGRVATTAVSLFDHTSGIEYAVTGHDRDLRGSNIDKLIPIALSLLLDHRMQAVAPGAAAQTTATAETPATALPASPPTCTAKTLGGSRASNPGLAADCDTLLAIQSTLRVSGWIDYDTPLLWDHSYALNWSARTPLTHWRAVTLGGTPERVTGLDFSDTRESVRVFNARTRRWAEGQPFTREWTLRGVIPTQLENLTALETLDLGESELTGIVPTQLGKLTALTNLDLSNNKLTGELPTGLDDLDSLGRVRLAGNAFTGCAPASLWRITSHDLDALGLPNCKPPLTYGAPSRTGIVDAPGEHAFFTNSGPALTYEALRNDVSRMVIHKQDAGGVPRDAIYGDMEAGDDFEWREADDCWVRYVVEQVLPDPTDIPLKVLAVRRYGYAYTGCSGMVSLMGERTLTWVPPNIQSPDITVPVRHGIWLLLPPAYWNRSDWDGVDGVYEERVPLTGATQVTGDKQPGVSTSLAAVQKHPLWRTPGLPAGWRFSWGMIGYDGLDGYQAIYNNARGGIGAEIYVYRPYIQPQELRVTSMQSSSIAETRTINGHHAIVKYSPSGSTAQETTVWMFDAMAGIAYVVVGLDGALRGAPHNIIDVTRSIVGGENP